MTPRPHPRQAAGFAVLILALLACQLGGRATPAPPGPAPVLEPPTLQPATPQEQPTLAPSPAPWTEPRLPAGEEQVFEGVSDPAGTARFDDPLSGQALSLRLLEQGSEAPLAGIQVTLVSNGPQVLAIAIDPAGVYLPAAQEFSRAQLIAQAARPPGRFISNSSPRLTIGAAMLLVTVAQAWQTMKDWYAAYSQVDVQAWGWQGVEVCISKEGLEQGELALRDTILLLPIDDFLGLGEYVAALGDVLVELLAEQHTELVARQFQAQPPAILRWRIYTLQDRFPYVQFAQPVGFCLDPLDSRDGRSALSWLLYGLEEQSMYAFEQIVHPEQVGFAFYIEGGQSKPRAQFLRELAQRLPAGPVCQGLTPEGDWRWQVWTDGWSPAWQMTEMCYVDCQALVPPVERSQVGLFLEQFQGLWRLQTVWINTPQSYIEIYNLPIYACDLDSPAQVTVEAQMPPTPAVCPGAPPQQMRVGEQGYVCTRSDAVILRAGPQRSSAELTRLQPGTTFTVLDGPRCADTWSWWQIRSADGWEGWIAEGGDRIDPYFICPLR